MLLSSLTFDHHTPTTCEVVAFDPGNWTKSQEKILSFWTKLVIHLTIIVFYNFECIATLCHPSYQFETLMPSASHACDHGPSVLGSCNLCLSHRLNLLTLMEGFLLFHLNMA